MYRSKRQRFILFSNDLIKKEVKTMVKRVFAGLLVLSLLAMALGGACAKPAPTPAPSPKPAAPPTAPAPSPAAPAPSPTPAQKITLSAVGPWKADHKLILLFKELLTDVNKRAAGQLEIQYKGGPELIAANDQLTACGEGRVNMFYAPVSYYQGIVPEYGIMGLNVVDWTYENHPKLRESFKEDIIKITEKKTGTTLLAQFHPLPLWLFTTKKPIKKVADLKGLKIRTAGGWDAAALQALGTAPVNIASGEIYTSAMQGVIDGGSRPIDSMVDWKEYEVFKYMVSIPIYFNSGGNLWMNLDSYKKLPDGLKKILLDAVTEWDLKAVKQYRINEQESLKFIQAQGVQVVDLDPGEADKWKSTLAAAAEPYFLKVSPEYGQMLINKLKAAAGK
jgi:TRAP-type C4-dicarboxylate transport system substrate-binding protein